MLRDASEYRMVSQLAYMTTGVSDTPLQALTPVDLVDLQEIEFGIDHNSKMGLQKYIHHHPFSQAVQRYILRFGFTLHGKSPAPGVEEFNTVSW